MPKKNMHLLPVVRADRGPGTAHFVRRRETRYRKLFDCSPHPLFLYSTESLRILEANKAAKQFYGYSPDEFQGLPVTQIIAPEEHPKFFECQTNLSLTAPSPAIRTKHIRKDKTPAFVEVTCAPVRIDGRTARIVVVTDIANRVAAEAALQRAELKYRSIFENVGEGIFQTTPEGRYLSANPALARMYGYSSPEELKERLTSVKHQLYVDSSRRDAFVRLMHENDSVTGFEAEVHRLDGSTIWISENARPVRDPSGNLLYYEGTVTDITERKRFEEQVKWQAFHDGLTRLPNRQLFQDRLEQALATAVQRGKIGAVLFLDLDNFKRVNDSLGHTAGDLFLQQVALLLRGCLRPGDTLARMGGDEFTVLLPEIPDASQATVVAERMFEALSHPVRVDEHNLFPTASIGISVFPRDGEDSATILKHADVAMYRVKERGRGHFAMFSQDMNASAYERLILSNQLRTAIENRELTLHYQPLIDMDTGLIEAAEALVRWQHPQHGRIPPAKFIPLAEETGLILPLGDWVLQEACRQAVAWRRGGFPIRISVNMSAKQFVRTDLVENITAVVQQSGLRPEFLDIELTESTIIENGAAAVGMLSQLKDLGVTVSVDDFGTGYSSLSYLRRFPVDGLKIDRSFVMQMERDSRDQAVVRAIIDLAHALGLRVVAEGVETEGQRKQLDRLGCNSVQGYLISPPVPAAEFEPLLTAINGRCALAAA